MSTFEHDSENAVTTGHKWTPVLRGEIYCSPGCGGGCKKSDYDKAVEKAGLVAAALGYGWKPRVYENLGWHYEVTKGQATVVPNRPGGFTAIIRVEGTERDGGQVESFGVIQANDTEPRQAVQKVLTLLSGRIARFQRVLASISLEPLELQERLIDESSESTA